MAGWIGLLALAVGCLKAAPGGPTVRSVGWRWWTLAALTLLCFRWPLVLAPFEFNPDEAQLIAGAMTLRHDPVFWRSVDGITAGPLDFFPLWPATFTTGLTSFTIERLIGLAGLVGCWIFAGESLAIWVNRAVARAAVLPAVAATVFTRGPEFLYFSTEIPAVLLLSAAVYFAARQTRSANRRNLWIIGLLLGAVPWSKLQATPISAVLWISIASFELRAKRPRSVATLLLSGLIPSLAFVGMATVTGQAHHMLISYLLNNVGFIQIAPLSFGATLVRQGLNSMAHSTLGLWLGSSLIVALVAGLSARRPSGSGKAGMVTGLALLAVSTIAILLPRRDSAHYLYFLGLPLILTCGGALAILSRGTQSAASAGASMTRIRLFIAATLLPQMAWAAFHPGPLYETDPSALSPSRRQLADIIKACGNPGEPLGIWGWRSALYVDTGMIQATREGQTEPQMKPGKWQAYFRQRYLDDLIASDPRVFVDTVGSENFIADRNHAHESFARLAEWLERHYTFVRELSGVRIYVRKDQAQPTPLLGES